MEFLAAMLAAKTFLNDTLGVSVLIQLNNITAVAYINNTTICVAQCLTDLPKELWMRALNKDIILSAQQITGVSNIIVDIESQSVHYKSDCMLCPQVV